MHTFKELLVSLQDRKEQLEKEKAEVEVLRAERESKYMTEAAQEIVF